MLQALEYSPSPISYLFHDWNALWMVFQPSVGDKTVESYLTNSLVLQYPNDTSGLYTVLDHPLPI